MPDDDPRTTVTDVHLYYLGGKVGHLSRKAVERLNRLSHDRGNSVEETLEMMLIVSSWIVEMKK